MTSSGTISLSGPGKDFKLPQIPGNLLPELIQTMQAFPNDTTDFSKPYIRTSLQKMYPMILTAYVIVLVFGVALNVAMLVKTLNLSKLLRLSNQSFTEYLFSANISVLNIVMCLLVVPLSLAIMLVQNWIFGRFLCYTAPILQDVPLYGGLLSLLGNAVCRHRSVIRQSHPFKRSFSKAHTQRATREASPSPGKKLAAVASTWLAVAAAVAPQAGYIQYYDLEASLGTQFKGVCLCIVDTSAGIVLYNRVLLVVMYILPLLSCAVLLSKSSSRLATSSRQHNPGSIDIGGFCSPIKSTAIPARDHQYENVPLAINTDGLRSSLRSPHTEKSTTSNTTISRLLEESGHQTDQLGNGGRVTEYPQSSLHDNKIQQEIQKFQIITTIIYGMCLCPLMILRLLKNMNFEVVPANHMDAILICFVWIAVLQTTATPVFFLLSHRLVTVSSPARCGNPESNHGSERDIFARNCSTTVPSSYSMIQNRRPNLPCNVHHPSNYNTCFDDHTNHFHQDNQTSLDLTTNFHQSVPCPTHRSTNAGPTQPNRGCNLSDNRRSEVHETSRGVRQRSPQRYDRDPYYGSSSIQREPKSSLKHSTLYSDQARVHSPDNPALQRPVLQVARNHNSMSRDYSAHSSYLMQRQSGFPDTSCQRSAKSSSSHRTQPRRAHATASDQCCQREAAYRGIIFQN